MHNTPLIPTTTHPCLHWQNTVYSAADLHARANQLAHYLAAQGLRTGDVVALIATNHLAHIDLLLAATKTGILFAPLNPRLTPREQNALLSTLQPKLIIAATHVTHYPTLALGHYPDQLGQYPTTYSNRVVPTATTPIQLLHTGGTTGTPKAAIQTYGQLLFNCQATAQHWQLHATDVAIHAMPICHASFNALALPVLHIGAQLVLQTTFSATDYLKAVVDHQATRLFLVPTLYQTLAEHPDFTATNLNQIHWAISGGAPCPTQLIHTFKAKGITLRQGYGLTEAGVNCFYTTTDLAITQPHTVGYAMPGTQAVIRQPAGTPVNDGEIGELTLAGPHLFGGYYRNSNATAAVLKNGWLWTGDLARRDSHGVFEIVGRQKDLYLRGGQNVYPKEIEQHILEHPAVAACAVVGIPDKHWGETGAAAVVLKPNQRLPTTALKDFLRQRLARYKVPTAVHYLTELPLTGAGKVAKMQLIAQFSPTTTRPTKNVA